MKETIIRCDRCGAIITKKDKLFTITVMETCKTTGDLLENYKKVDEADFCQNCTDKIINYAQHITIEALCKELETETDAAGKELGAEIQEKKLAAVKELIASGGKLKELKELLGAKYDQSVYNYLDKHGIDLATRKAKPQQKSIYKLHQETVPVMPVKEEKPATSALSTEPKEYPLMTVEAVREKYTNNKKIHMSEVAKYFGKRPDEAHDFVTKNGLRRTDKRDSKYADAERLAPAGVQA